MFANAARISQPARLKKGHFKQKNLTGLEETNKNKSSRATSLKNAF